MERVITLGKDNEAATATTNLVRIGLILLVVRPIALLSVLPIVSQSKSVINFTVKEPTTLPSFPQIKSILMILSSNTAFLTWMVYSARMPPMISLLLLSVERVV